MGTSQRKPAPQITSLREFIESPGYMEAVIIVVTLIAYMGSLTFGFVSDDRDQILNNPQIHHWASLPGYFTHSVWAVMSPYVPANYYRPVFFLWLRINYVLFGTHPFGWHATTILLHAAVGVLMFRYVWRVFSNRSLAAVAALLFVLHPVHVESVTWISGGTDPLMAVLMLAAALAFLQWSAGRGVLWYTVSLVSAALAVFSKETAVLLPFLLLATVFTSRNPESARSRRTVLLGSLPFFAVCAIYLVARQNVLHGFAHPLWDVGVVSMILSWPAILAFYLRQLVLPITLSPYYDLDFVRTWRTTEFWVPLIFVLLVGAATVYLIQKASRRRQLWTAVLWFALPLLPVLYVRVFNHRELVHDRYLYLPSLGACILLAAALQWIAQYVTRWPSGALAARAGYGVIFVLLGIVTLVYQTYWVNDIVLYTRGITIAPLNNTATVDLGVVYIEHNQLQRGMAMFEEVIKRSPYDAVSRYNLGRAEYGLGHYAEAERLVAHAIVLDPNHADWWLMYAGVESKLGNLAEAEKAARQALVVNPDGDGYHVALGAILLARGDRNAAASEFQKELQLHPGNPQAIEGLRELQAK